MSIIVDALERVQSDRETKQQSDEFLDSITEHDDSLKPLEETHVSRENNPPKQKNLFSKTNIIIALFVALFISFAFLFKQVPTDSNNRSLLNPYISGDLIIPRTDVERASSAIPAIDFKKHEDDFFNQIEKELNTPPTQKMAKQAVTISEPATGATKASDAISFVTPPVIAPTENVTPNETSERLPETSTESDTISTKRTKFQNPTPGKNDIVFKPLSVSTEKTAIKEPALAGNAHLNWFALGKIAFQSAGLVSATPIWSKGFSSLPADTPIISIMINRVPQLATNLLTTLHEHQVDAFTVEGLFKKELAYFTLSLAPTSSKAIQTEIREIGGIIDGKPFRNTHKFIQKRIDLLNPAAAQTTTNTKAIKSNAQKIRIADQIKPIKPRITNDARLRIAKADIIKGRYPEAIKMLRPVLFNSQGNWEVLFWIGSAKLGLGLYNEADDYFKKGLALNPDISQLWIQRAIIAQERNDHINALVFLNKAQIITPKAPEVFLNIAYSNDALGDRNGAIFAYREFLSLTEENTQFSQQRRSANQRLHDLR